jgi:hypothetical protein
MTPPFLRHGNRAATEETLAGSFEGVVRRIGQILDTFS